MLCNVTGALYLPNGQLGKSLTLRFKRVDQRVTAEYLGAVVPNDVYTQSDKSGQVDFDILTGVYVMHVEGGYSVRAIVPDAATADIADCIDAAAIPDQPPVWYQQALNARDDAVDAADRAEDAADQAAGAVVADYFVATDADRLALSPSAGQTVYVSQTGHTWEWNGTSWVDMGAAPFALQTAVEASLEEGSVIRLDITGTGDAMVAEVVNSLDDLSISAGSVLRGYIPDANASANPTLTLDGITFTVFGVYGDELPAGALQRSEVLMRVITRNIANPIIRLMNARLTSDILGLDEAFYRASLWQFLGDGAEGIVPPETVSESGHILSFAGQAAQREDVYRATLWQFMGDGETSDPPLIVSEDGLVIASISGMAGGGSSSRVIDIITDDGQSNGEGAAYEARSVVYGSVSHPALMTALRGASNDPWLGMATGGGDSIELDGNTITGIGPMGPQTLNNSGTLAGEAVARAMLARGSGRILTLSNAEGGQSIYNLLPDPSDPTKYAFQNIVTWMERLRDLADPADSYVYRWLLMQQGESNRAIAALGERHEQYRAAVEAEAMRIFGQTEALRMISWQFSSTPPGGSTVGVRSILDYAIAHDATPTNRHKVFFCGGPTYQFPWAADYLHQSSIGHAMRGETGAAIIRRIEDEGFYLPLHPVTAEVSGTNEITVLLSEAAEQATDGHVDAVADLGVNVDGATISDVVVSGREVIITTGSAAADATEVGFGMQENTDPRTREAAPRTNIRAIRPLGAYSATLAAQAEGGLIRSWMCHQQLPVAA